MTNYVNWLQNNQVVKADALQTLGNAVSNYESPLTTEASGVAPEGSQMAVVWADVPFKVSASNLIGAMASDKEIAWPANSPLEIIGVQAGKTKITMTDL